MVLITGFATGPAETNCYFVALRAGAGAVVIDPGDESVPTLEYYFSVNDLTPVAVLLTCGAPEHSACAFDLCTGWDIPLYVHPADRGLLDAEPERVVELADGQRLELADIDVDVDHIPGHTPGAVVFRVAADTDEGPVVVAFTGDTLVPAVREKLLVLDDTTVVLPGHGTSTSIGAARRSNPFPE